MSRIAAPSLWAFVSLCCAPWAMAQEDFQEDEIRAFIAYSALLSTPVAMLDPALPELEARPSGGRFIVRYGRMSDPLGHDEPGRLHSVSIHAGFPAGRTRLEASFGRLLWCQLEERGTVEFEGLENSCSGTFAAGLSATARVFRVPLSGGGASALSVGIRPALGFKIRPQKDDHLRAFSADVTAPIALTLGSRTKVVLYAAPGVAWGRLRSTRDISGEWQSGFRRIVGFGVAIIGPSGLGVTAGGQKVLYRYASTQFGAGLVWHPGRN